MMLSYTVASYSVGKLYHIATSKNAGAAHDCDDVRPAPPFRSAMSLPVNPTLMADASADAQHLPMQDVECVVNISQQSFPSYPAMFFFSG